MKRAEVGSKKKYEEVGSKRSEIRKRMKWEVERSCKYKLQAPDAGCNYKYYLCAVIFSNF